YQDAVLTIKHEQLRLRLEEAIRRHAGWATRLLKILDQLEEGLRSDKPSIGPRPLSASPGGSAACITAVYGKIHGLLLLNEFRGAGDCRHDLVYGHAGIQGGHPLRQSCGIRIALQNALVSVLDQSAGYFSAVNERARDRDTRGSGLQGVRPTG